jgi:hypothetical protein
MGGVIYEVLKISFRIPGHQWRKRVNSTSRDFQRMFGYSSLPVLSAPTSNRDKVHWVTRLSHCPSHSARARPLLPRPTGKERPVTGFRHELIGKFLAARYVRRLIGQGVASATIDYISLSAMSYGWTCFILSSMRLIPCRF